MRRISLLLAVFAGIALTAANAGEGSTFFNGKDLDGFEGLLKEYWSVKDGAIVGTGGNKKIPFNTFLCSKKKYKDFEMSFEVRLKGGKGNSGIQIRSHIHDRAKFAVTGPQCDMGEVYWGSLYGENFGGMMKASNAKLVKEILKVDDFNDYYIKCVGKHVTIKLNGKTMVDDDFAKLPDIGIVAFQIHGGHVMEVTFRKIQFKGIPVIDTVVANPVADPKVFARFPDLEDVIGPIAKDSGKDTWRQLASLMSFPYTGGGGLRLPILQRLYLPSRSVQLTSLPKSGFREADNAILYRFDQLVQAAPTELQLASKEGRAQFQERLKIALTNQALGNTPDSSFRQFAQYLSEGMGKLRDFEEQLKKDEKSQTLSRESLEKFQEFQKAMNNQSLKDILEKRKQLGNLPPPVQFSAYMLYADFAAVDRQASYWQKHLLPLAKKASGPAAQQPLIEVTGNWSKKKDFERLAAFDLKNKSEKALTNVVVELIAENNWGEKAVHYFFFKDWQSGALNRCIPHPRWDKRRLDFVTEMKVSFAVWSDQASFTNGNTKLTSPNPNPDPDGWRKDYVAQDDLYQPNGEAWGWAAIIMQRLPSAQKP